jgi:2-aminoadipate transaminase
MRLRAIDTSAERILITSGAQQGIDLTAKVFIERGDEVVVENPCYLAAIQTFSGYEASFTGIESDHDGMMVDQLEKHLKNARPKLIYIVSEFSNPKGTTLSYERRLKLIDLSARYGVPILEDNPYTELRYEGNRPPPLAALDTKGMVIHLGSFSKTLSPGMRLGWLTASEEIFQNAVIAKQSSDLHTSTVEQRAAARLLHTFDYDGHIRGLCSVYGERCRAMRDAVAKFFPAEVKSTKPEGGLFLWVELPERVSAEEVFHNAIAERVAFVPGTSFFAVEPKFNFMRLNFSNQQPELIEEGIRRIGAVLERRLG